MAMCQFLIGVGDWHRLHDVLQFFETSLKHRIVKNWKTSFKTISWCYVEYFGGAGLYWNWWGSTVPQYRFTTLPQYFGTKVPRCQGTTVPRYQSTNMEIFIYALTNIVCMISQGCRRFETSVFFSVKINISTTGGFRAGFFQPDTNHP